MKWVNNIKHLKFIALLLLIGVCYYYRAELTVWSEWLIQEGIKNYEAALNLPGGGENIVFAADMEQGEAEGEVKVFLPEDTDLAADMEPEEAEGEDIFPEDTVSGSDAGIQQPAWEYAMADEGYFDDALFLGDSRTVGLREYGGITGATFCASTGLSIYKLLGAQIAPIEGSTEKQTVEELLMKRQFSKIYLMIGINELGTGTVETFMNRYQEVVARLQELQPDAIIYVQAIMRVSTARSSQGDSINNEGINVRNEEIAKLADGEKIFYLDVNPLLCDEEGGLLSEYTADGVHLRAKYVTIWTDFLYEHTIRFLQ